MTQAFSPEQFLDMTMTAPLEKRPPIAIGDYNAIIGEPEVKTFSKSDGTTGMRLVIPLEIDTQGQEDQPPVLKLSDSAFLDLTPSGTLDMSKGKNRTIRVYREALDLNKPGDQFSFRVMQGRMVRVSIKHELYEGNIQERIGGVARPQ